MGTFYMPDNRGWIMHESLGWVFVLDEQEKGIWIWQQEIGWFWTNPEIFPYLFQNSSGNWLFLHGSAKNLPFYSILEPVNGLYCKSNDFFTDIVVIKFLVIIL